MKPGVAEWKGLWDKDVYHKPSQEIKICEQKKKNWRHKKSLQFLEINTEFGIKKQLARVGSRLIAAWKQWRKAKLLSTHTPPGGEDAKWLDRLLFGGPEREKKGFEIWLFFSDLSRTDMAKCPMIRPQTPHKEKNKSNQKKRSNITYRYPGLKLALPSWCKYSRPDGNETVSLMCWDKWPTTNSVTHWLPFTKFE